jgi:hypothetical protein
VSDPAAPIELRPVVLWFAQQMELRLRENDHKGGWHEMDPSNLVMRAQDELSELEDAVDEHPMDDDDPENADANAACIREAADIANMVLMVADHFRDGGPSEDQGETL